jgi:hypothetical protein
MPEKGTVPRVCVTCGRAFLAKPSNVRRGGGRYCSRVCFQGAVPLSRRWWDAVQRPAHDADACPWLWTRSLNRGGYGVLKLAAPSRRQVAAHRHVYEQVVGPIPAGMMVAHRCDIRPCVRPACLFVTDAAGNSADMVAKGRSAKGSKVGTSNPALNDDRVRVMRLAAAAGASQYLLARAYGISRQAVRRILERTTWAHVR